MKLKDFKKLVKFINPEVENIDNNEIMLEISSVIRNISREDLLDMSALELKNILTEDYKKFIEIISIKNENFIKEFDLNNKHFKLLDKKSYTGLQWLDISNKIKIGIYENIEYILAMLYITEIDYKGKKEYRYNNEFVEEVKEYLLEQNIEDFYGAFDFFLKIEMK